jgi:hypothetical protein
LPKFAKSLRGCTNSSALGRFRPCVFAGHFIEDYMRHCQMTQDKFDSEVRQKGYVSLAKVFAVTLEPPGKFAIFTKSELCQLCCWAPEVHFVQARWFNQAAWLLYSPGWTASCC